MKNTARESLTVFFGIQAGEGQQFSTAKPFPPRS